MADATCAAEFRSSGRRVSVVVRPAWSVGSRMCSYETKRREFLHWSPYRARYTGASIFIVHLAHVRTPIQTLSHGIFSLIRRNILYIVFGGEYFMSVMASCDFDITSLNDALLQHAARCQIQRVAIRMWWDWQPSIMPDQPDRLLRPCRIDRVDSSCSMWVRLRAHNRSKVEMVLSEGWKVREITGDKAGNILLFEIEEDVQNVLYNYYGLLICPFLLTLS